jgi:hypothetical protein
MFGTKKISQSFVKAITANFVVAKICNLHDCAALDTAEREIERAATPIEDKNGSAFQSGKLSANVWLRPQIRVKRSNRFVDELHHPDSRLSRGLAQRAPFSPPKVNGNGHDGAVELLPRRWIAR